jgi:hypothetical protein
VLDPERNIENPAERERAFRLNAAVGGLRRVANLWIIKDHYRQRILTAGQPSHNRSIQQSPAISATTTTTANTTNE